MGPHHIDLRRLSPAPANSAAAADLAGTGDHTLHGCGAFGEPPSGWRAGRAWIGRQPQTNNPERSWGRYFAEQRVRPFVRKAVDVGHLAGSDARMVEAVCDRISEGAYDDDRPPARIHGDLWSGNVVFTSEGAVLIDPAAHGGHGLTDLAMLDLFGCPYLEQVLTAYADASGLPARWRRLIPLHQLHPSRPTRPPTGRATPVGSWRQPTRWRDQIPFCSGGTRSATLGRFPSRSAGDARPAGVSSARGGPTGSTSSVHPDIQEIPVAANCDVCGKGPSFGHNISHSHRRTKRRWNPNIQRVRTLVDGVTPKRINVCTSCLKAGKVAR